MKARKCNRQINIFCKFCQINLLSFYIQTSWSRFKMFMFIHSHLPYQSDSVSFDCQFYFLVIWRGTSGKYTVLSPKEVTLSSLFQKFWKIRYYFSSCPTIMYCFLTHSNKCEPKYRTSLLPQYSMHEHHLLV